MIEGDAVIHELGLPAPVEQVFDMFTDPRQLVRWIGLSADLQPRPGGRFRFEIMPGQFCEGQYLVIDRPHRLVFTWGWTDPGFGLPPGTSRLEITLAPAVMVPSARGFAWFTPAWPETLACCTRTAGHASSPG